MYPFVHFVKVKPNNNEIPYELELFVRILHKAGQKKVVYVNRFNANEILLFVVFNMFSGNHKNLLLAIIVGILQAII